MKWSKNFLKLMLINLILINNLLAAPFSITRTGIPLSLPVELRDLINDLFDEAENDINANLTDADASTYLNSMSNASVMSVKGLGVDYASNPDIFIFGVGVGAGIDMGNKSIFDLFSSDTNSNNFKGIGLQTSLMAGIQLGVFSMPKVSDYFDFNRMSIFVNYMGMDLPKIGTGFSGKIKAFGLHFQYKLVNPVSLGSWLFKWGGVDVTTGFDRSTMNVIYSRTDTLAKSQATTIPVGPTTVVDTLNLNIIANSQIGADIAVTTIPIEISTNVQLLYFFSLFGGLGFDFNSGSAKALVASNSNFTMNDSLGYLDSPPVEAEGNLDLGDNGKAKSSSFRYFAGAQFNFSLAKLYIQFINKASSHDALGVSAGLRIAW